MRGFMPRIVLVLVVMVFWVPGAFAQESSGRDGQQKTEQEKTEQQKTEQRKQEDIDRLRRAAAEAEKKGQAQEDQGAGEQTFKAGSLGLQKLNPEISVTGDMLGVYQSDDALGPAWDTFFRGLGLHFESYLDPYSRFKAAVGFSGEEAELEEAYFTRFGIVGDANLTLGKFRQQFGIVNRWHKHALDWFDFPLALRSIFGPGGLNSTGLSFDALGATGPMIHSITVQVTNGSNPSIFGENLKNRPSILAYYDAYQDLSPSTYLEFGLTGLVGWNDTWAVAGEDDVVELVTDTRTASVYGADLNVLWEPTGRMRYRNLQWRSEAYLADKRITAPDGSGEDRLQPWGLYSLLQAKVSRTVELGVRYDYFQPEVRSYASLGIVPICPAAVAEREDNRHLGSVWLTWWQSPFVKFRGGYTYEKGGAEDSGVHSAEFQMVFAAGPHKHERY